MGIRFANFQKVGKSGYSTIIYGYNAGWVLKPASVGIFNTQDSAQIIYSVEHPKLE